MSLTRYNEIVMILHVKKHENFVFQKLVFFEISGICWHVFVKGEVNIGRNPKDFAVG